MKKRVLIALTCVGLVMTGCGSSSSYDSGAYEDGGYAKGSNFSSAATADYAVAEEAVEYDDYEEAAGSASRDVSEEDVAEYGSKIIRNANLSMDVKNLDEFAENLKRTVEDYGGYVESSDVNSYDSDYSESRYGYFTVRIPAERLDDFLGIVKDEGTVTAKSETAEDVTLQYVDIEAHIATYEAERDSLMELLDRAETIEDVIKVREQLSNVNYELDSLNRQLKSMQNKVSYSTVNVNAKETRSISIGGGERSFFSRIGENFVNEFADGWEAFFDVLIFIVTRIPLFAILGLFVYVIVKIVKKIAGTSSRPKMTRAEKKQARAATREAKKAAKAAKASSTAGSAAPNAAEVNNVDGSQEKPVQIGWTHNDWDKGNAYDSENGGAQGQGGGSHYTSNMNPDNIVTFSDKKGDETEDKADSSKGEGEPETKTDGKDGD